MDEVVMNFRIKEEIHYSCLKVPVIKAEHSIGLRHIKPAKNLFKSQSSILYKIDRGIVS